MDDLFANAHSRHSRLQSSLPIRDACGGHDEYKAYSLWGTRLVIEALMDTREGGHLSILSPHVLYAAGRRGGWRSNDKQSLDPGI